MEPILEILRAIAEQVHGLLPSTSIRRSTLPASILRLQAHQGPRNRSCVLRHELTTTALTYRTE